MALTIGKSHCRENLFLTKYQCGEYILSKIPLRMHSHPSSFLSFIYSISVDAPRRIATCFVCMLQEVWMKLDSSYAQKVDEISLLSLLIVSLQFFLQIIEVCFFLGRACCVFGNPVGNFC